MIRRILWLLATLLPTNVQLADAQQAIKIPHIGYLEGGPVSAHTSRMEAFRRGLREFGYEEGRDILIEWRFGDGNSIALSAINLKAGKQIGITIPPQVLARADKVIKS